MKGAFGQRIKAPFGVGVGEGSFTVKVGWTPREQLAVVSSKLMIYSPTGVPWSTVISACHSPAVETCGVSGDILSSAFDPNGTVILMVPPGTQSFAVNVLFVPTGPDILRKYIRGLG